MEPAQPPTPTTETGMYPDGEPSSSTPRWLPFLSRWWQGRSLLARLGSESPAEREAALAFFVARGEAAWPALRRALRGPVGSACGAAVALERQGNLEGIAFILTRCYEEEWLLRSVRDGHPEGLHALRLLGREPVGTVLHGALSAAARERDLPACLSHLTLALSGLRVLSVFDDLSPCAWWERALCFGHQSLRGLRNGASDILARNLTDSLRWVAVRGLLVEYPAACLECLVAALGGEDASVGLSAVRGLQKLGDRRALPALQAIAFTAGHPLAVAARRAVEQLAGSHADSLLLLRAAEPETEPEELLRPALPDTDSSADRNLMRPAP